MTTDARTQCVVGIDPGMTGLSACLLEGDTYTFCRATSSPEHSLVGRIVRFKAIAETVQAFIQQVKPRAIAIEGYAFNAVQKAHYVGELGGLIREVICNRFLNSNYEIFEIPPAKLKQFITHKGNAKKAEISIGLQRLYGVVICQDDDADAYALARMAACLAGLDKPRTLIGEGVIESILNPPAPKPKKPRKRKEKWRQIRF